MTEKSRRSELLMTREDLRRFESRVVTWLRAIAVATGILAVLTTWMLMQSLLG